jgi:hypothetical protein
MTEIATVEWLGQDPIDRDDEWYVAGYKRLYGAFIGANLLIETLPPKPSSAAPYRLVTLPLATGGDAVLAFTDHKALHRAFATRGHDSHETLDSQSLCAHVVELGVGVIVNLGSEFSRFFDGWEAAWVAAGVMPLMARPTEDEVLTELTGLLRGFMENREIDSAQLTGALDMNDAYGFAIVLSPVGRWPAPLRQAIRDDFKQFASDTIFASDTFAGIGLALIMVGSPPAQDHEAMITLV